MSKGIPPWLEPLLETRFFAACRSHVDSPHNECNMFCLDCILPGSSSAASPSFCYYCHSSRHRDHRVVQIRRSSYHDVVRVGEMQEVIDLSGVQTYVINSARVIFLNERPQQPKSSSSSNYNMNPNNRGGLGIGGPSSHPNHNHNHRACEICWRSLLDTFRFCSLGCKLVGVKRNGNTSFDLGHPTKDEEIMDRSNKGEIAMTVSSKDGVDRIRVSTRRGSHRCRPAQGTVRTRGDEKGFRIGHHSGPNSPSSFFRFLSHYLRRV